MHRPNELQIRIEPAGGRQILHAAGELSIESAEQLRTVLLSEIQPGTSNVLDLEEIEAIDLCGLQLLCSAHRTAVQHDAAFEFLAMTEAVRKAARDSGYDANSSICRYRTGGNCLWKL